MVGTNALYRCTRIRNTGVVLGRGFFEHRDWKGGGCKVFGGLNVGLDA